MYSRKKARCPAIIAFVLLAVGITVGTRLPVRMPWILALVCVLCLLWLSLLRRHLGASLPRGSLFRSACALILTGAVLWLVSSARTLTAVPCGGLRVNLVGEVADPPAKTPSGWRFLIRPEWVAEEGRPLRFRGLIAVTLLVRPDNDLRTAHGYGTRLGLRGLLTEPPGARNPGEFDLKNFYRANGIQALLLVRGSDNCTQLPGGRGAWLYSTVVLPVRQSILDYIDRTIGGSEGEFLKGLVLGIRTGMSPQMRDAFVNAGVAHILAVSGSNVAVIAGFLYGVLFLLRIPAALREGLVAVGIIFYMILTGSQPPVVRATIMALLVLAGKRIQRPVSGVNSLGVAGILILLLEPAQLFDVGFQLSFSAVLAIVVLYNRSAVFLGRLLPRTRTGRVVRAMLALAAVSLVATIGTLPLTALYFERVSVIGLVANMLVVPISGLSVVLGIAGATVDLVWHRAGDAYAALNAVLLHWTLRFTMLAGSSPIAVIHTAGWSLADSFGIVSAFLTVFYLGTRYAGRLLIMSLAWANLALLIPPRGISPPSPGALRVIFVDVGQGDCALVQLPNGELLLIDVGEKTPRFDQGERTIVPLLYRLGAVSIQGILLSHPHRDHIGGYPAVRSALQVTRTYSSAAGEWPQRWRMEPLGAGDFLTPADGVRLYVLWPSHLEAGEGLDGNNASLVLRLQYGRISILFTGDIESHVEECLVSAFGEFLRCNLLKVPHHGAATGCTEEFLSVVRADHAVVSVGSGNRFSHPSHDVIRRIVDTGSNVWRTDCCGALVFDTDGQQLWRNRWNDERVRCTERPSP